MKSWGQIDSDFDLFLNDSARTSYLEPLRIAAFNRACEYFAVTHTAALRSVTAYATAYAMGTIVSYPSDFIELPEGGVATMPTNIYPAYYLHEASSIQPGYQQVTDGQYVLLGDGIYLPGGETQVTLWYYARWNTIASNSDLANVPPWSEWGVMNLSLSYMLMPSMMNQQLLRQFQTKRDAGDPEMNPPRKQAEYCFQVYQDMVASNPRQNRSLMLPFTYKA